MDSNTTTPQTYHIGTCSFLPAQNFIFQIGCVFFLLALLSTDGIIGCIWLRICLIVSNVFLACWGWIVLCAIDIFIWNIAFVFINMVHACVRIYYIRPVALPSDLQILYEAKFKKYRIAKHDFKKLVDIAEIPSELMTMNYYAQEGVTYCDRLSYLVWGSLKVSMKGELLHHIQTDNFIDSPEFLMYTNDEKFQVTIIAEMPCLYISWNRDDLVKVMEDFPSLRTVLDSIIAKDITKKLLDSDKTVKNLCGFSSLPDIRVASYDAILSAVEEQNNSGQNENFKIGPDYLQVSKSKSRRTRSLANLRQKPVGILRNKITKNTDDVFVKRSHSSGSNFRTNLDPIEQEWHRRSSGSLQDKDTNSPTQVSENPGVHDNPVFSLAEDPEIVEHRLQDSHLQKYHAAPLSHHRHHHPHHNHQQEDMNDEIDEAQITQF